MMDLLNLYPKSCKEEGKTKLVYHDHLSSILHLKNLPRKKKRKEEKRTIWNLARANYWTMYEKVSDEYSEELEKIVEDRNITIQEAMNKFERLHEKIKFKVFGKVSIGGEKKKTSIRWLSMAMKKKGLRLYMKNKYKQLRLS